MIPIHALPIFGLGILVGEKFIEKKLLNRQDESCFDVKTYLDDPQKQKLISSDFSYNNTLKNSFSKKNFKVIMYKLPKDFFKICGLSLLFAGLTLDMLDKNSVQPDSSVLKTIACLFVFFTFLRVYCINHLELKKDKEHFEAAREIWVKQTLTIK